MDRIVPLPAFSDNYMWCLIKGQNLAVVDPGEAAPILNYLEKHNLNLKAVLVTHHHYDHTNGLKDLVRRHKDIEVFGSDQIPFVTTVVKDQEKITLPGLDLEFTGLSIPAHTLEHVAYFGEGLVFTGDTLFTAGCGRIFEGNPEMMYDSLAKLTQLPLETLVYCGHEYTLANLKFALMVEPDNRDIRERLESTEELRAQNQPTVPATLALERKTNPFLRCDQVDVIRAASHYASKELQDPVSVLKTLREWKNTIS